MTVWAAAAVVPAADNKKKISAGYFIQEREEASDEIL
jgi:hypothetical protein